MRSACATSSLNRPWSHGCCGTRGRNGARAWRSAVSPGRGSVAGKSVWRSPVGLSDLLVMICRSSSGLEPCLELPPPTLAGGVPPGTRHANLPRGSPETSARFGAGKKSGAAPRLQESRENNPLSKRRHRRGLAVDVDFSGTAALLPLTIALGDRLFKGFERFSSVLIMALPDASHDTFALKQTVLRRILHRLALNNSINTIFLRCSVRSRSQRRPPKIGETTCQNVRAWCQ
jgi:hypothetical protein